MRLWFARRVAVRYSRSEGRETKTKEDCAEGDSLKSRVVPGGENLDGDIMGVLDEVLLVGSLVVGKSLLECFDVLELLLGLEEVGGGEDAAGGEAVGGGVGRGLEGDAVDQVDVGFMPEVFAAVCELTA